MEFGDLLLKIMKSGFYYANLKQKKSIKILNLFFNKIMACFAQIVIIILIFSWNCPMVLLGFSYSFPMGLHRAYWPMGHRMCTTHRQVGFLGCCGLGMQLLQHMQSTGHMRTAGTARTSGTTCKDCHIQDFFHRSIEIHVPLKSL